MSVGTPPHLMTIDEFLDLPEKRNVERMLIRGELWESKMTTRNPWHSSVLANLVFFLKLWQRSQNAVAGTLLAGDAGFRLSRDPDSLVGIDVAFVAQGTPLHKRGRKVVMDGPPLLAAEILSPSDRLDDVEAKVDAYLAAHIPLIWTISSHRRTVTVYRPDAEPELFTQSESLSGEPHLPGLSIPVGELFVEVI